MRSTCPQLTERFDYATRTYQPAPAEERRRRQLAKRGPLPKMAFFYHRERRRRK